MKCTQHLNFLQEAQGSDGCLAQSARLAANITRKYQSLHFCTRFCPGSAVHCRLFQALPYWAVLPLPALQNLSVNTFTRLFPLCCLSELSHPCGRMLGGRQTADPGPAGTRSVLRLACRGHGWPRGQARLRLPARRARMGSHGLPALLLAWPEAALTPSPLCPTITPPSCTSLHLAAAPR